MGRLCCMRPIHKPWARVGRSGMIIRRGQTPVDLGTEQDRQKYGPSESLHLSDAGGLTEFGAHVQPLRPGDAACWPAGVANAHQVVNCSEAPCTYLVVGSRGPVQNVTRYPDRGNVLYDFEDGSWRLQCTDGSVIREGKVREGE